MRDTGSELGTVLAIGGIDPTGGAGILADAAAIRSVGLHAAAVVSVTTVQDGRRFAGARAEEPGALEDAIRAVLAAQPTGAVKTGALGTRANVEVVARLAGAAGFPPLVVDPVLSSTSGGALLDDRGLEALRERLLPAAALVTPNVDEAARLTGQRIESADDLLDAGHRLQQIGARGVLLKGGHLPGPEVVDLLLLPGGEARWLRAPRVEVGEVRGTGCTLAALIAAHLARGATLAAAVERARAAHQAALLGARRLGSDALVHWFGCDE